MPWPGARRRSPRCRGAGSTSFAGLCDAFLRIDLTKDLARIACPTLVLVAENDILKGERFARIIADHVPGARLRVIPEAGHAVVVERPAEVAAAIAEFLDGLPREARMAHGRDGHRHRGSRHLLRRARRRGAGALRAREHGILPLVRARHGRRRGADDRPGHAELRQVEAPARASPTSTGTRTAVAAFIRAPRPGPARARRPLPRRGGRHVARGALPAPHPGARARGFGRAVGARDAEETASRSSR